MGEPSRALAALLALPTSTSIFHACSCLPCLSLGPALTLHFLPRRWPCLMLRICRWDHHAAGFSQSVVPM